MEGAATATKPKPAAQQTKNAKTTKQSGSKSSGKDKTQREQEKKAKQANQKKAQEEKMAKDRTERYIKNRVDYKDPYQLSEGEIMIVIEHSDDPGRVLMSTSHDYDKYKRIASKIRQWIMRDFPSMKVIIKPNNHMSDNKRIGCFEISYFHKHNGELIRQDIFSKMIERKWPKWKTVQEKIKKFVKNSDLTVTIKDISKERKNQFEGMVVHVKNVLFAKNAGGSGNTTKSLVGSDLQKSQHSQQTQSTAAPMEDSTLTKFQHEISREDGVLTFKHLPVGNYAIVFDGNRTYNPVKIPFQVFANEPTINIVMEVDLVEEAFFSLEVDLSNVNAKRGDISEEIGNIAPAQKAQKGKLEEELKKLDQHEKSISQYKFNLVPSDDGRGADVSGIPIYCEKSTIQGSTNAVFEAVIEPGDYDLQLINGAKTDLLKKKFKLTRGENKFVLDPARDNQIIDEHTYRDARRAVDKQNNKPSNTAAGSSNTQGKTGTNVGKQRPDTTSSLASELDESHNRLGSAEVKGRPGSASTMNRTQDMSHMPHTGSKAQVIDEDPAENAEEQFMVKLVVEEGDLPFEMHFIYEAEEGVTQVLSRDNPPTEGGYLQALKNKEVLCLEDVRRREGFYRMIITRRLEVTQFSPVHVMVNCGGTSIARKFTKDPFTNPTNQLLDFGVFKFPDNTFMPINIITSESIDYPTYMLSQIRSLISKLSESKLGVDKIFGFGGAKTERHEGEDCLPIKEAKKSLEVFMIPISDHILQAFKLHQDGELISLKRLTDTVDVWKQNIHVLDEINEEEEGEDEEDYDNFDEFADQA